MAERTEALTAASAPRHWQSGSYVDWPAIIAGAIVASAIMLLFAGFGATLGLSAVSAEQGEGSGTWALVFVGAWLLITIIVSYGAGGYIAGRMRRRMDGAAADEVSARDSIHGIVVWSLALLLSGWLAAGVIDKTATAVGDVTEGAATVVGGVAQGAAAVVGDVAKGATSLAGTAGGSAQDGLLSGMDVNPLQIINDRLLRGTGVQIDQNPELPNGAMAVLADVVRTGEIDAQDRAWLTQALATNSNLTPDEAKTRVDDAVKQVVALRDQAATKAQDLADKATAVAKEAEEKARAAAEAARKAAVLTGFAIAAALVIAFAAAVWGSVVGGRHRDEGRLFGGFRGF